jgi:hypothetical protein
MDMEHNMKIGIYDGSTNKQTEREATEEEVALREAEIALTLEQEAAILAQKEAALEAKAALLDRLGITADEAKLLLG